MSKRKPFTLLPPCGPGTTRTGRFKRGRKSWCVVFHPEPRQRVRRSCPTLVTREAVREFAILTVRQDFPHLCLMLDVAKPKARRFAPPPQEPATEPSRLI